jgi:hypothetical protein
VGVTGRNLYTVAVFVALGALGDLFPSLTNSPYGIAVSAALVTAALWPLWRRESHPFLRVAAAVGGAVILAWWFDRLAAGHKSITQFAFVLFAIIGPAWWLLIYLRDRRAGPDSRGT